MLLIVYASCVSVKLSIFQFLELIQHCCLIEPMLPRIAEPDLGPTLAEYFRELTDIRLVSTPENTHASVDILTELDDSKTRLEACQLLISQMQQSSEGCAIVSSIESPELLFCNPVAYVGLAVDISESISVTPSTHVSIPARSALQLRRRFDSNSLCRRHPPVFVALPKAWLYRHAVEHRVPDTDLVLAAYCVPAVIRFPIGRLALATPEHPVVVTASVSATINVALASLVIPVIDFSHSNNANSPVLQSDIASSNASSTVLVPACSDLDELVFPPAAIRCAFRLDTAAYGYGSQESGMFTWHMHYAPSMR